jgi:hypothetical protein
MHDVHLFLVTVVGLVILIILYLIEFRDAHTFSKLLFAVTYSALTLIYAKGMTKELIQAKRKEEYPF